MPSQPFSFHLLSAQVSRFSSRMSAVVLGAMCLALPGTPGAQAQTAHFGVTRTLKSGYVGPFGIAVDANRNVFVSDESYATVSELTAASNYATVISIGSGFYRPYALAVDASGNLFVADYGNDEVREFFASSGYTTMRSIGSALYSLYGVAVDGSGNVFVTNGNSIKEYIASGNYTTANTLGSGLSNVYGVAVDASGNVFVADSGNNAVKEIPVAGGYTTTVSVGSGFNGPEGVAVDAAGNVFVSDTVNGAVKEILAAGGYTTTLLVARGFTTPSGLAVDSTGNVYVADYYNQLAQEIVYQPVNFGSVNVGTSTPVTHTFTFTFDTGGSIGAPSVVTQGVTSLDFNDAGTGTCTTNGTSHVYATGDTCTVDVMFNPKAPGMRSGAVALVDASNNTLAVGYISGTGVGPVVSFQPAILQTHTSPYSGSAYGPTSVATDAAGNAYIVDDNVCYIEKFTAATQLTTIIAGTGSCAGSANGIGGPAASANLREPFAIAVNGRGDIFFSDQNALQVFKIDAVTNILTVFAGTGAYSAAIPGPATSSPILSPQGLAADASGNLYIADSGDSAVLKVDTTGNLSLFAGNGTQGTSGDGGPATSAELESPVSLAFDAGGSLYIADPFAHKVRKVDGSTGSISTVAGAGSGAFSGMGGTATAAHLPGPQGVAVDAAGNLYIADQATSLVYEVAAATQTINIFAGTYNNGSGGYTGDNGPPNLATLNHPYSVAVDPLGTVYIADLYNGVIRQVTANTTTASFGATNVGSSSSPVNVTVGNIGNAPLAFTALSASTNFNLNGSGTSCTSTGTVAVGETCVLGIEFLPTASGALTGTITLTDNAGADSASTQAVTTSGTGNPQAATQLVVSGLPTTQPFGVALGNVTADVEDANGNVVLGSTAAVTVTVTGPGGYTQTVMGSAVNGVATLDLSGLPAFATPGTYTVTTTSPGLTAATSTFVVVPPTAMFQPTSLGSVNVGASTAGTHTFTFTFAAGGMINAPSVVTQGIAGLDFTDAGTGTCDTNGPSHAYNAGDTCTVNVTFNPKAPGLRTGAVVLTDSSNNTLATGYLSGTGVGPLVGFQPAIIRTPALGLGSTATPYAIVVDPAGNVFVSDNSLCVINKYTAATQTTAVYAGTGSCTGSQSGDGGAATSARLGAASGLAIDGRGNLLFTDSHSVRSIDPATGIITTVAGTGGTGASVAGPATSSPFQNLQAIVVDSSGNFYAADEGSHVVVKVTPGGTLSLYAGTTVSGPAVDGGLATQTTLNEPFALAIDAAANLYIGDIGNVDVRRVDATTGIISTVAGNGAMDGSGNEGPATSASVYSTEGLALDVQGNLYIADEEYSTIRVVSAADGIIHAFAGVYNGYSGGYTGDGGPANAALLGYPTGIAFDGTGTLYIADTYNYVVRTIGNPGAVPSFGSVASNNTSAALDVSVVNLGNAPLDFTALTPSANFNLNGADTTCTTTTAVAAGASCVLGVEFLPTTSGAVTGTITLADNAGTTGSGTQMVTTSGTGTPQTATQLALSGLPTAQPSGVPLGNVTASVEDANGNVVLGSTAAVTVTVTGPGGYSQVVTGTSVNGVATLNLSGLPAFTATGTYTVTTTSAGLTTATSTFTVVPPATQIGVSAPPAMLPLSGNLGSQTATVEDANGNVVPNPAATITTTVTGPGGYTQTVTATTVNGVATLNLSMLPAFTAPGTYTETTTSSTGLPPVTITFIVGALPATQIAVSGLPTNVAFGGNLGTVTATLENVNGAVATGSTAVVTATITGPGGFSQVVTGTAVNGVVSLDLSGLALTTPGTYTVAVTSPNLATSTSTITVAAATGGQAAQLAVTGLPAQLGQSSNLGHITASVETSTGAVVTTSAASVTLTLTGPGGYTQMVTVAAVNGVAGFDLSGFSFTALGTYTLTVTSPGLPAASYTFTVAQDFTLAAGSGSGGSPTVTVLPGAPATFALTLAPAGTTFTQPITLSATGLPPGATYSFNPPIVTPGPSAATSTLTITTATTTAALRHLPTRGGVTGLALAALLLPFGSRRLRRSAKRLSASGLVAMLLTLAGLGALTGCAKHGFYGQTPQTYVVTVTATSGSFSHSTTVTLTEQ